MATSSKDSQANNQQDPSDDEARGLKLDQTKWEARKAIAEAQKATLEAQLPTSDTKPLEGKVDVGEKAGLVADLLAHSLLNTAAKKIVSEVKPSHNWTVLVVEDRALVATDWPYELISRELVHQEAAIQAAVKELKPVKKAEDRGGATEFAPLAVALAAPALIGAAATIVGMFRTDYSITSRAVTIGTTPLVAAVVKQLRLATPPPGVAVDGFHILADSPIVNKFWTTWAERTKLERLKVSLYNDELMAVDRRIDDQRAELKAAATEYDKKLAEGKDSEALKSRLKVLQGGLKEDYKIANPKRALVAAAEAAIASFDAFATGVVTAPKGGGYPPLVAAALRERLHAKDKSRITHLLYIAAEAAGGETITKRSLFGPSGQVGFIGGCQVSYLLHDVMENQTIAGGTETLLARLEYDLSKGTVGAVQTIPMTNDH